MFYANDIRYNVKSFFELYFLCFSVKKSHKENVV